jgi:L-2-hydroxyglutarate oxidase
MTHYKKYFQKEVNKLITKEKLNLQFGFEGTRAQCISKKGELVDDFVIEKNKSLIILRNVPSPAATSCLAIAQHIYLNYLKH